MARPNPPAEANPYDPYKTFKFRLKWDGKYVAGFSKVSDLTKTTEVVTHRGGGPPSMEHTPPGQVDFSPITLERGVTHDEEFELWANKVWTYGGSPGKEVSLKDFRKDVIIELYNEAGQKVLGYRVYRCWVSEFTALPGLDANESAIAIQSMRLECEGWERDLNVCEPEEPSF